MSVQIEIEPTVEHEFRVLARDRGEVAESAFVVTPDMLAEIGSTGADAGAVARYAAEFLAGHQPVIDFPPLVYLDEVAAAFADFPAALRDHLAGLAGGTRS